MRFNLEFAFVHSDGKISTICSPSSWVYGQMIQPPGYSESERFLTIYGEFGQIGVVPFGGRVEISACSLG